MKLLSYSVAWMCIGESKVETVAVAVLMSTKLCKLAKQILL